jgi:phage terminase small subunit
MTFLRRKQQNTNDQPPSQPASDTSTNSRSPKSTVKQEKFVEGVLQHGNATKAAIDAGYSPRSAAVLASRNLKRPDIKARIKSRIDQAQLDTDEIIGTLVSHMRADVGDLLGDDGTPDLARAIENGARHIIKKIKIWKRLIPTKDGELVQETTYEIVLHDAQAAARQLARLLQLEERARKAEEFKHDQRVAYALKNARAMAEAAVRKEEEARAAIERCAAMERLHQAAEARQPSASTAEPGVDNTQQQPAATRRRIHGLVVNGRVFGDDGKQLTGLDLRAFEEQEIADERQRELDRHAKTLPF